MNYDRKHKICTVEWEGMELSTTANFTLSAFERNYYSTLFSVAFILPSAILVIFYVMLSCRVHDKLTIILSYSKLNFNFRCKTFWSTKRDLSRILGAYQDDIRQMTSLNRKISKLRFSIWNYSSVILLLTFVVSFTPMISLRLWRLHGHVWDYDLRDKLRGSSEVLNHIISQTWNLLYWIGSDLKKPIYRNKRLFDTFASVFPGCRLWWTR